MARHILIRKRTAQDKKTETTRIPRNPANVPKILPWKCSTKYYVNFLDKQDVREIWECEEYLYSLYYENSDLRSCRRLFQSREYAQHFADECQHIADMLHIKYLYDRDYEPNWEDDSEKKYFVYYNCNVGRFCVEYTKSYIYSPVCFSNEEVAELCAEWLTYLTSEEGVRR